MQRSPQILRLNIGGIRYETTRTTLLNQPSEVMKRMFGEDSSVAIRPNSDGEYFIDRNGKLFEYILDYLRTGEVYLPDECLTQPEAVQRLWKEAEYYDLIDMQRQLIPDEPATSSSAIALPAVIRIESTAGNWWSYTVMSCDACGTLYVDGCKQECLKNNKRMHGDAQDKLHRSKATVPDGQQPIIIHGGRYAIRCASQEMPTMPPVKKAHIFDPVSRTVRQQPAYYQPGNPNPFDPNPFTILHEQFG